MGNDNVEPKAKKETFLVRCLGPCAGEFKSPDKARVRICPACKKLIAGSVSARSKFYESRGGRDVRSEY